MALAGASHHWSLPHLWALSVQREQPLPHSGYHRVLPTMGPESTEPRTADRKHRSHNTKEIILLLKCFSWVSCHGYESKTRSIWRLPMPSPCSKGKSGIQQDSSRGGPHFPLPSVSVPCPWTSSGSKTHRSILSQSFFPLKDWVISSFRV